MCYVINSSQFAGSNLQACAVESLSDIAAKHCGGCPEPDSTHG